MEKLNEKNISLNEESLKSIMRLFRRFSTRVYTQGYKDLESTLIEKSNTLTKIAVELESAKDSEMLGFLFQEIQDKALELEKMAAELRDKFLIFVVGMGKYGKSTLVNALVGSKVAETDILPKTWKIDIYEESDSFNAKIRYKDGTLKEVSYEEALEIVKDEERKRIESEEVVVKELNKALPFLKSVKEKEELKKALAKQHLYISNVKEIKWPVKKDNNTFLSNFRIVDTPGLYQDTPGLDSREDIRQYYHKAHGILWLIDATKIASQKPRQILDEINETLEKIGSKTRNIIGVLNRVDLYWDDSNSLEKLTKEAHRLFGNVFRLIVPISAKMAEKAVLEKDSSLLERSGLNQLLDGIDDLFLAQAAAYKYQSALDGLKLIQSSLLRSVEKYLQRIEKDYLIYKELEEETNTLLEGLKDRYSSELRVFFSNYRKDVLANIERFSSVLLSRKHSDQLKERFLRENLFRESYFVKELNSYQLRIIESLENASRILTERAVFREFESLSLESILLVYREILPETFSLDSITGDEVFAIASALTFAASGLFFGPMGFVVTGISSLTGLLRQAYISVYQLPKLRQELEKYLDALIIKSQQELLKRLNDDLDFVKEQVTKVRDETYFLLHGEAAKTDEVIVILRDLVTLLNLTIIEDESFGLKEYM